MEREENTFFFFFRGVSLTDTCTTCCSHLQGQQIQSGHQVINLWLVFGEYFLIISGEEAFNFAVSANKIVDIHCKEETIQWRTESGSKHNTTQGSSILSLYFVVGSKSIDSVTQTLLQSLNEFLQYRFCWITSSIPNH